ncbi:MULTISPECIES: hypothetical protein [Dactylosporangium]|uniref:Uncharacterized protein n=2 Tax=Dactylosporangium TaxID=35753 RepID=A0A9W6KG30_9ACTN|nr:MULTISPECIES: hypothetical protein [Dactylosporangium]UAB97632.1 hypothetical protein Dvina_05685 [Dactylosporangium vinaceum]UWZ45875.1 hypothetical protein Dmats_05170 [Dactylosporangium matsuzakiense]GLL00094.1 hypothetical protein GCM10017581_018340 [Dactylosporangium matsuzakiense]
MTIDGRWRLLAHTPRGDLEWMLSLSSAGATFTGTLTITEGVVAVEDGRIDGDSLTWTSHLPREDVLRCTGRATVSGDRMAGELHMGTFGSRSFGGARCA